MPVAGPGKPKRWWSAAAAAAATIDDWPCGTGWRRGIGASGDAAGRGAGRGRRRRTRRLLRPDAAPPGAELRRAAAGREPALQRRSAAETCLGASAGGAADSRGGACAGASAAAAWRQPRAATNVGDGLERWNGFVRQEPASGSAGGAAASAALPAARRLPRVRQPRRGGLRRASGVLRRGSFGRRAGFNRTLRTKSAIVIRDDAQLIFRFEDVAKPLVEERDQLFGREPDFFGELENTNLTGTRSHSFPEVQAHVESPTQIERHFASLRRPRAPRALSLREAPNRLGRLVPLRRQVAALLESIVVIEHRSSHLVLHELLIKPYSAAADASPGYRRFLAARSAHAAEQR